MNTHTMRAIYCESWLDVQCHFNGLGPGFDETTEDEDGNWYSDMAYFHLWKIQQTGIKAPARVTP